MAGKIKILVIFFLTTLTITSITGKGVSKIVEKTLPFMASILESGNHYCTGVVLNSRTVLLTALCQENISRKLVLVGTNKGNDKNESLPEVTFRFPHPSFDFHTLVGDVAVVHVKEPLTGSSAAKIINRNLKVGEQVGIRGWDMDFLPTKSVFNVSTTVIDPLSCTQHYGSQFNPTYMICLDYYEMSDKKYGGCEMDPSAPVFIDEDDEYRVAALGLFMPGCLFANWPGVYINLFPYRKWILRRLHPAGQ